MNEKLKPCPFCGGKARLQLTDKETPKKPIDIEFGPCGDLMLCCPTCKHGVVPIPTYHGNKYYPRCPFCGQLLKGDGEDGQE